MSGIRAAALTLSFSFTLAHAGVVTLGASKDNTLYESTLEYLSNGAGQHCFAGVTAEPTRRRALIAFDIQSAVPAGAAVIECTLTLHMSKSISGPAEVTLHRTLEDWGEGASDATGQEGAGAPAEPGDATWIHTDYPTYYWTRPGGNFDPSPSAATVVAGVGDYSWGPHGQIVADAQAWLDGGQPNYGWLIAGDESTAITAKRFDTRENPIESARPALRIVYRPACIADWNSDGAVNTLDVLGFLNEWAAGELSADLNDSGDVNTIDVLEFLNAWVAGC